ncbi:MAG: diguanylate cyclase [Spirochaetia bacterium]
MSKHEEAEQRPEAGSGAPAHHDQHLGARGLLLLLSGLSQRSVFWVLAVGSLVLAEVIALAASLIAFHAIRADIMLVCLVAAGITSIVTAFTVRYMVMRMRVHQERLERFATMDELTGSPNRRVFRERLESEVDRCSRLGTRLCVVFVDIDFFKRINDDYGHQVGDSVLKEIYARLEESLRPYDFVGRFGGDEFIMALPGTDVEGGVAVAERLRESVLAGPVGKLRGVTISLGVAQLEKGMTAEMLLSDADIALYRAKNSGRNRTETHGNAER